MSAAQRLVPLGWLHGEIEQALAVAGSAAGDGDWPTVRDGLTQIHGALTLADCLGGAVFARALVRLAEAALAGRAKTEAGVDATELASAALDTLTAYLRRLLAGAPDRAPALALALYPMYRQVLLAAHCSASPADLFFPDLSRRPPPRAKEPAPLEPAAREARLKAARLAFKRGWDKWREGGRSSHDQQARALRDLRNAVAIAEQHQSAPAERAFWWICIAFFDALADSPGDPGDPLRQELAPLLARIDGQIAKLATGSHAIAQRLLRDVLYEVAVADSQADAVQAVRAAYRLAELMPTEALDGARERQRNEQRQALAAAVLEAQAHWENFHAGSAAALPAFDAACKRLADLAEGMEGADDGALLHLADAIANNAQRLRKKPLDCNEAFAEEMAVALLLLEAWAKHPPPRDAVAQAGQLAARLDALRRDKFPGPAMAPSYALDLPDQVRAEIAANLAQAETLLAPLPQPVAADALAAATLLLKQAEGALALLGRPRAAQAASGALLHLARLSRAGAEASREEQEAVADGLALLTAYVDRLAYSGADLDEVPPAAPRPPGLPLTVEAELEQAQALARSQAAELQNQPEDVTLRAALSQTLQGIEADARLVADEALADAAAASLAALAGEAALDQALAPWLPVPMPEPAAFAETDTADSTDWHADWEQADGAQAEPAPLQSPAQPPAHPPTGAPTAAMAEEELPFLPLPEELQSDIDARLLPLFLEEARAALPTVFEQVRRWRNNPQDPALPGQLRRHLQTLKGSAQMAGVLGVAELAQDLEDCLDAADVDALGEGLERMAALIDALGEEEMAPALPPPERPGPDMGGPLPIPVERVDQLLNDAGEIAAARGRIDTELGAVKDDLGELKETLERLTSQVRELAGRTGARQDDRGEELRRQSAETLEDLTTLQQRLVRGIDQAQETVDGQGRLNRGLTQNLLALRLAPFGLLSERLYRVVRQTAQDQGKQATLAVEGASTEVDRAVLERIAVPLEHLLRNAVAHGIELPALRRQAGKADEGRISLAVRRKGSEVALEVADDGAGLDLARIRQRGEASGLLVSGATADAAQLTALIFEPGFSTAPLSADAGHGLGLDLVRHEVAALGGRIEVDSEPGRGCRFRLTLPQTLALGQVLLVKCGGRRYGIPAQFIEQAGEISAEDMAAVRRVGGSSWAGGFYPWHYLPRLLGDRDTQPRSQRRYWRVLIKSGTRRIALEVDGTPMRQEVVMKPIGPQLARVPGIAGATVLGNGEIVLLLDPAVLAERAARHRADDRGDTAVTEPARETRGLVLVVDDSLTARRNASRGLERAGYRVLAAHDGLEALTMLAEEPADIVVTDIDMPGMDGIELLRNLRGNERLARIPVVVVSALAEATHREQVQALGVQHWLAKPYDEAALVKMVEAVRGDG